MLEMTTLLSTSLPVTLLPQLMLSANSNTYFFGSGGGLDTVASVLVLPWNSVLTLPLILPTVQLAA